MALQSEQIDALAKALAAAQAELLPAIKDAQNPHLRNRYADLASCWDAIKACLPHHGLSVVQGGCTRSGRDYIRTTMLHASGQWIAGMTPIIIGDPKGINPMQALGSAMTYARRYGLAAICGLTAEDDDGAGAGHPAARQPERPRQPDRPPQQPPTRPEPHTAGDALDKLTARYLDRLKAAGLASPDRAEARRWELWNHLATAAVEQGCIPQDAIHDFDGKRSQSMVVKALKELSASHKSWLQDEILAYITTKLQPQEAAR